MKKNRRELLNLIIALFALVVAIVSIWFSYYTYKDTKAERINIIASTVLSNFTTKLLPIGDNVVIPIYWELILTNNSEKTISITDINVESNTNEEGVVLYSHIYDGLFENIDDFDNNYIDLPLNINTGESKKAFIRIGILCDSLASKIILQDNFLSSDLDPNGKWIRFNQAKIKLAEQSLDFYGNKSSVVYENEEILNYESEAKKQQQFEISFLTGKNNVIKKVVKLYMMKE